MNRIAVTGIGTDVGKTIVSAIVCEAYACSYWKPVQAGDLDQSDSLKINKLCSDSVTILPEKHRLTIPASPHYAAQEDGVFIEATSLGIPNHEGNLLIEAAGGLMVPINNQGFLFADLIENWKVPVILVSRHYLGSINHTLLTLEALAYRKIEVKLIIWVGENNTATQDIICHKYPNLKTHRIPWSEKVEADFIKTEAAKLPIDLFN